MNELIINGVCFLIEQERDDELTIFGEDALPFISEIIKKDLPVVVSKERYRAEEKFMKILEVGVLGVTPWVRVEVVCLKHLSWSAV